MEKDIIYMLMVQVNVVNGRIIFSMGKVKRFLVTEQFIKANTWKVRKLDLAITNGPMVAHIQES